MRWPAAVIAIGMGLAGAAACQHGFTSPSTQATACNPSAASARLAQPFLSKPFDGDFALGNLFDHDKPLVFSDSNGYQVSMCGARVKQDTDGHDGYDWRMPEGTPLFAVADGVVMFAGLQAPSFCPPLHRNTQPLYVQMRHTAPDGTDFISVHGHLSRVDVKQGDVITRHTTVGLSGNTGCSGTPHLHFSVFRARPDGDFVVIDPYGWHADTPDPWESDSRGIASVWLWRPGEAPGLR